MQNHPMSFKRRIRLTRIFSSRSITALLMKGNLIKTNESDLRKAEKEVEGVFCSFSLALKNLRVERRNNYFVKEKCRTD